MEINKTINGKDACFEINGRLDTSTAPELEKSINSSISEIESLVLDFKNLEYISSAGLRVILKTQKEMSKKGGMRILNVNDSVMEVFDITGFSDILTIEK